MSLHAQLSPEAQARLHAQQSRRLYTSDAADDLRCVDLGGRRIIKKKKKKNILPDNSHDLLPVTPPLCHIHLTHPHPTHTHHGGPEEGGRVLDNGESAV